MYNPESEIVESYNLINRKSNVEQVDYAVILGSGLGALLERLNVISSVKYSDIPALHNTTVQGHKGQLGFCNVNDRVVAVFCGRSHYYEGHGHEKLGNAVRIAHALKTRAVLSTCAVGALHNDLDIHGIYAVKDHLNLSGINPLAGVACNPDDLFVGSSNIYHQSLRNQLVNKCKEISGEVIYTWVSGPSYETKAEVNMFRKLGGDVVGMSMVPEALTAARLKMKFAALACVSNYAHGVNDNEVSHKEVIDSGIHFIDPLLKIINSLSHLSF